MQQQPVCIMHLHAFIINNSKAYSWDFLDYARFKQTATYTHYYLSIMNNTRHGMDLENEGFENLPLWRAEAKCNAVLVLQPDTNAYNVMEWWRETEEAPRFKDSATSIQIEQKMEENESRVFSVMLLAAVSFLGLWNWQQMTFISLV
jgi:hypothetical protein